MSNTWPLNQLMTDEEYASGNHFKCPNQNCPSHHDSDIEFQPSYGTTDQVGKSIYQEVICDLCGSQWTDIYVLVGYDDYQEGTDATN